MSCNLADLMTIVAHLELLAKRRPRVLEVCGCSHALSYTLVLFALEQQTCHLREVEGRL